MNQMCNISQAQEKMQAAIDHLVTELKSLRTGRANPALLDNVQVEVYGTQMRLRDVASVTAPEARQLVITPSMPITYHAVAKGIDKANLGYKGVVDGKIVRINIPQMDTEMRKEMVKTSHKRCEKPKSNQTC